MTRLRVVSVRGLDPAIVAEWRRIQAANPALASPFFSPEYAMGSSEVFGDAEVAVIERDNRVVALFPFQRGARDATKMTDRVFRQLGAGGPVGRKHSDIHGVICARDEQIDVPAVLAACGLKTWDFNRLPVEQLKFATDVQGTVDWSCIDLVRGYDAFVAERRRAGSNLFGQTERKARRLQRQLGPLRYVECSADTTAIDTVLRWRAAKYPNAEHADGVSMAETSAMLKVLQGIRTPTFAGQLSLLYAGDHLVAGHFGMRTSSVFNYWFLSYDEQHSENSPGMILLLRLLESSARNGIARFDLGTGSQRYKQQLTTQTLQLGYGSIERPSLLKAYRDVKRGASAAASGLDFVSAAAAR